MKRRCTGSLVVVLTLLTVGIICPSAVAYAYDGHTVYQWDTGVPNYNPSAVVHSSTIDISALVFGDFIGVSPPQPNAPGYGDSGAIVGWDDSSIDLIGDANTNGDYLDAKWVKLIYPGEGWWDLGFPTNRVVVFSSLDQGPYLAKGLEYRVYGSNSLWGSVSSQAVLTDIYLDGWRPHNPVEDTNGNGWCSDDISAVLQLPGNYRYIKLVPWGTSTYIDSKIDAIASFPTPPTPTPTPEVTPTPTPTTPPAEPAGGGGGGGGFCFIATAAYGSSLDSHVDTLRSFRDQYLETNPIGSAFVSLYYKVSPPMAEFINEHPALKPIVRAGLVPAVVMSTVAVDTTPMEKIAIASSLAFVCILVFVGLRRKIIRGKF